MRMVEDFYDLEPAPNGEDQQADYLEGERESSLAIDHFAEDEPANTDSSNFTLRSMTCQPTKDTECNCNCDQSCKKGRMITSRRV